MDTQNAEEEKQKDNENKIVQNENNNNNNKLKKPTFEKDEDYKEFDDLLDVIYSDKNIKSKDVNKREIEKLKTITLTLIFLHYIPLLYHYILSLMSIYEVKSYKK